MNSDEVKTETRKPPQRKGNMRQLILVGVLLVVLGAFLYDRYYLMPNAEKKINQVMEQVSQSTHEGNQQQIHELLGRKPSNVYEYQGYQIEQFRFPRGLPFYPRPVLDIAFKDGAVAFFSQIPLDEGSDALKEKMPKINRKRWASDERESIELKAQAAGG